MENKKDAWERSYRNRDNFVFYPHEEVIRFVARHIRKRVGLTEFSDASPLARTARILDLGCGIGRHVLYLRELGLSAYGIDLSESALEVARTWASAKGLTQTTDLFVQGDIRQLPWPDDHFQFAVSHGVLDSMPFEIARTACLELSRKMSNGGLFYCDLVSGDDSLHAPEYCGEEIVKTRHELDTVQSYFNMHRIEALFDGAFLIQECVLIRREDTKRGQHGSRFHLTLQKP